MNPTAPDSPVLRKARGAFFTPEPVARYVASWAVTSPDARVLEPSCGEAVFLLAAGRRLRDLGASGSLGARLQATELHAGSAVAARDHLRAAGLDAEVEVADFLATEPSASYDAVIGNPPYVRYQSFAGDSRAVAQRAALAAGVRLTNLASSWAAFTVHAARHVRPGGRLGLVLPAEMLTVNYAAPVRDYLRAQFRRVRLVLFAERVFPGVLEDVVLVLAAGRGLGPAGHFELLQTRSAETLADLAEADVRRWAPVDGSRWSAALLPPGVTESYAEALGSYGVVPLADWGETTLGMVTGNNRFFARTRDDVQRRGLTRGDVVRISPPGSRHLRALTLSRRGLAELDAAGARGWLFRPAGEPSPAGWALIVEGERAGVDAAYKCRVREPWWRVPEVRPADLLLTYMNADTARLCANPAGVHHLNSVHGVSLTEATRDLGRRLLPLAALNSLSLLGAELVGRSYGGGILKLEPREADRWPVPAPDLVARRSAELAAVRAPVRALVRAGQVVAASELVDEALWGSGAGEGVLSRVRVGRAALHDRRTARSSRARDRPTAARD